MLSWLAYSWLVTYRNGITAKGWSPIPVLSGLDVGELVRPTIDAAATPRRQHLRGGAEAASTRLVLANAVSCRSALSRGRSHFDPITLWPV